MSQIEWRRRDKGLPPRGQAAASLPPPKPAAMMDPNTSLAEKLGIDPVTREPLPGVTQPPIAEPGAAPNVAAPRATSPSVDAPMETRAARMRQLVEAAKPQDNAADDLFGVRPAHASNDDALAEEPAEDVESDASQVVEDDELFG